MLSNLLRSDHTPRIPRCAAVFVGTCLLALTSVPLRAQAYWKANLTFVIGEHDPKGDAPFPDLGTYREISYLCAIAGCDLVEETVTNCYDGSVSYQTYAEYGQDLTQNHFTVQVRDSTMILHVVDQNGPRMQLTVRFKPEKGGGRYRYEATRVDGAIVYPDNNFASTVYLVDANDGHSSFILPCRIRLHGARRVKD